MGNAMNQPENSALIVGAGTMGIGIAAIFIAKGWHVTLIESDKSRHAGLHLKIQQALEEMAALDLPQSLPVAIHADMAQASWTNIRLVIETVYETLALKQAVFKQIEKYAPADIPLTSNSSSIPISEIGRGLPIIERMLGLHFFMPAQLVPAVEVVCSAYSRPDIAAEVMRIMKAVGKRPILVKKDVPGFLANRIQHALMREAIALVEEGFASAEDVDAAVRYGFGFRYIAAGPLKQKDLAGIDIHNLAAETMYPHLKANTKPSPYMQQLVREGKIGVKSEALQGFYEWTPERAVEEEKRYHEALRQALEIIEREDEP